MNKEQIEKIKKLLYDEIPNDLFNSIRQIDNSEILHLLAYNYNWDDGFKVPNLILNNNNCELNTALMIFYDAGGFEYLMSDRNKSQEENLLWYDFLENLYKKIINKSFKKGNIEFKPPVTKIQLYKLKKKLNDDEYVFIKNIGDTNMNIVI